MTGLFIFMLALIFFVTKKKALSLFLLACLVSSGFYIIGESSDLFGIDVRLDDLALLYVLILLLYRGMRGKLKNLPKPLNSVNYFFIFLAVSIFVDIIINGTSIADIIKTSRHWLFLLFVYLLPAYSEKDIMKAFKYILVLLFIELLLFLTEPITGKVLFSYLGTLDAITLTNVSRYGLFPPLIIFLFLWVFANTTLKPILRNSIILLVILAVLISLQRSTLIAVLMIFAFSVFVAKKQKFFKKFSIIFVIIVTVLTISFYEPLSSRFSSSIEDINSMNSGNVNGTSIGYRFILFSERFNYILENPKTMLFGIGLVAEKNYSGHRFSVGLYTEDFDITQLDTGDIAWALFAVRLGILGTILYLLIYQRLFKFFMQNRENFFAITGLYYIVFYFIHSVASIYLYYGFFILIPALLFQLVQYEKEKGLIK